MNRSTGRLVLKVAIVAIVGALALLAFPAAAGRIAQAEVVLAIVAFGAVALPAVSGRSIRSPRGEPFGPAPTIPRLPATVRRFLARRRSAPLTPGLPADLERLVATIGFATNSAFDAAVHLRPVILRLNRSTTCEGKWSPSDDFPSHVTVAAIERVLAVGDARHADRNGHGLTPAEICAAVDALEMAS